MPARVGGGFKPPPTGGRAKSASRTRFSYSLKPYYTTSALSAVGGFAFCGGPIPPTPFPTRKGGAEAVPPFLAGRGARGVGLTYKADVVYLWSKTMGDHKGRPYIVTNRLRDADKQSRLEVSRGTRASRIFPAHFPRKRESMILIRASYSRRLSVPRPSSQHRAKGFTASTRRPTMA